MVNALHTLSRQVNGGSSAINLMQMVKARSFISPILEADLTKGCAIYQKPN